MALAVAVVVVVAVAGDVQCERSRSRRPFFVLGIKYLSVECGRSYSVFLYRLDVGNCLDLQVKSAAGCRCLSS